MRVVGWVCAVPDEVCTNDHTGYVSTLDIFSPTSVVVRFVRTGTWRVRKEGSAAGFATGSARYRGQAGRGGDLRRFVGTLEPAVNASIQERVQGLPYCAELRGRARREKGRSAFPDQPHPV